MVVEEIMANMEAVAEAEAVAVAKAESVALLNKRNELFWLIRHQTSKTILPMSLAFVSLLRIFFSILTKKIDLDKIWNFNFYVTFFFPVLLLIVMCTTNERRL